MLSAILEWAFALSLVSVQIGSLDLDEPSELLLIKIVAFVIAKRFYMVVVEKRSKSFCGQWILEVSPLEPPTLKVSLQYGACSNVMRPMSASEVFLWQLNIEGVYWQRPGIICAGSQMIFGYTLLFSLFHVLQFRQWPLLFLLDIRIQSTGSGLQVKLLHLFCSVCGN